METATVDRPATEAATGASTLADLFPLAVRKHGSKKAVIYKDDSGELVVEDLHRGGRDRAHALARADRSRDREGRQGRDSLQHPPGVDLLRLRRAHAPAPPSSRSTRPTRRRSASTCSRTPTRSPSSSRTRSRSTRSARVRDKCPKLEHVIRMTGESNDAISMDELAERGAERQRGRLGGALALGRPATTSAPSSTRPAPPGRRRAA